MTSVTSKSLEVYAITDGVADLHSSPGQIVILLPWLPRECHARSSHPRKDLDPYLWKTLFEALACALVVHLADGILLQAGAIERTSALELLFVRGHSR
jgi:hypothetical protein